MDADAVDYEDGYHPLHAAAMHGQLGCVTALLDGGADVEAGDRSSWAALHVAAAALHVAVAAGHVACIYALLGAGADPNFRNNRGDTAVLTAGYAQQVACIAPLLEAGADPDAVNDKGWTPTLTAASQVHVKLMLALGGNLSATSIMGEHCLHLLYGAGLWIWEKLCRPSQLRTLLGAGASKAVASKSPASITLLSDLLEGFVAEQGPLANLLTAHEAAELVG
jgi:hypothetical protein